MRKLIAALSAAALLALGGCAQSIFVNYRDIESLRVVQALGLDAAADGGVVLSAASGPDASGREPLRLTREGESLDAAMRELEALTGGGQLFFAGTGAIVLGEAAADEAARWLDAVTRSKELRLDTELYVLRGGEAAELLCGEDAPEDVFAALDALAQRLRRNGPSPAPGCADAARALTGSGAALAAAIELEKGAEGKLTPIPAGFAVLTDSGLAAWLEDEAALGAGLFAGGPGAALLELGGVTVELAGAKAELEPLWADGGLAALRVFVEASGSVVGAPAGSKPDSGAARAELEAALAEALRSGVEAALEISRGTGADFLGLGRRLETEHPARFAAMRRPWAETLPELEFEVEARAKILNVREYADSPFGGEAAG